MYDNKTKILIGGDFVLTDTVNHNPIISTSIQSFFKEFDIKVLNFEAPYTTINSSIYKIGSVLKQNIEYTPQILKCLGIDVLTLANNHILDYGEMGVKDTLKFCKLNNIKTVGAGMNLKEAQQTVYLNSKAGRIAIVNFAENEWNSATSKSAGSHPMNIIDNVGKLKEAKDEADFVFLIIHGGHEYYNLPSPRIQKQYRFYADNGADIIIAHHPHCIGGSEIYKGVPIYYSLGNFIFTKDKNIEDWYIGLLLEVEIKDNKLNTQIHPIKQEKNTFTIKLIEFDKKQIVLDRVESYNKIISDSTKLSYEWENYISCKSKDYLNYWSPLSFVQNRFIKKIINKLGLSGLNKKGVAFALHFMQCEAHLDLSKSVLRKYLKDKKTLESEK